MDRSAFPTQSDALVLSTFNLAFTWEQTDLLQDYGRIRSYVATLTDLADRLSIDSS